MNTRECILTLFDQQKELSAKEITDRVSFSKQMVHMVLKQLLESGMVEKFGKTPKTIYRFISKENRNRNELTFISAEENEFLKKNFLMITSTGQIMEGINGFDLWCRKRKIDTKKTISEFIETKAKLNHHYNQQGNINGINQLKKTKDYDKVHLDHLFYLDFYAIERYGKTRLGTLLHYAKQGQDKFLMKLLMNEIRERIISFIKEQKADAIAFVPPTLRREVQIMKFIQNNLLLPLPVIEIKKLAGIIPVPQDSMDCMADRITNAENTYILSENRKFRHVVLVDDQVSSGATLNQIAGKLKSRKITEKVSGLSIVGKTNE